MQPPRSHYILLTLLPAFFLLMGLSFLSNQTILKAAPQQLPDLSKATPFASSEQANVNISGWISQTIDDVGDGYSNMTSIAVDSNNHPHIGYFNINDNHLMYAQWNGGSWITETVNAAGNSGIDLSLALDGSDHPYFSYYGGSGNLNYAHWEGSSWVTNTVDAALGAGQYNSIALDNNDIPHIAYKDGNGDLAYASLNGTAWITETVDIVPGLKTIGGNIVLDIDSQDYPHIGYRYDDQPYLMYSHWDGSQWIVEIARISYVTVDLSLALDEQDLPHLVYFNNSGDWNPEYVHWTGTEWFSETVQSGYFSGLDNSLAIDVNNQPHFSYYDYTEKDLLYAYLNGSSWVTVTVDAINDVGKETSLAFDNLGNPHISYFDETNMTLKYATATAVYSDKKTYLPLIIK